MEFWGVEVEAGKPLKVEPLPGQLIHISQAALGETTAKEGKGAKSIPLRLKIDDKDLILGHLKPEERTQQTFDLVFEREFVLSHDWKHGSIYFAGYLADDPVSENEYTSDDFDSSESEDELEKDSPAVPALANGASKAAKADAKKQKAFEIPVAGSDDDEDSEDDSDEDMASLGGDSVGADSSDDLLSGDDSDEDESEEEEEELPKAKVQQSKKRPAESSAPVSAKKAKPITPEKTGNKKGQNAAPSKGPAGKNASGNKSKQSPKSGGSGGHSGKKGKRGGK